MSASWSVRWTSRAVSRGAPGRARRSEWRLASTAAGSSRPFSTSPRHWARSTKPKGAAAKDAAKDNRQTLSELLTQRRIPLVAAGLAAMVIGSYVSLLVMSATSDPHNDDDAATAGHDCCTPTGRPLDVRQGRITALVFDQELNQSESRMGIKGLRKLMGGLARGHVLEVAVGTGRNVDFIDWDEIRATAPPPPLLLAGDGEEKERQEVKSEIDLEKDRVLRRMKKKGKGLVLPGDEAPEVVSYTGVDVSTDVLEVAWDKLRKAMPELIPRRRRRSPEESQAKEQAQRPVSPQQPIATTTSSAVANQQPTLPDEILAANIGAGRIRLYRSDAQVRLPNPPALTSHDSSCVHPAPRYYDTVLQNFGLCSVADPSRLLANMAAVVRPGSGRIYLLEHGRGSYGWLNSLLDKFAPGHFRKYGCWWNRDIEEIVRRAEKDVPGLEVVRVDRPLWLQGGTVLWIELRLNPSRIEIEANCKRAR
ncbi:hypothetical protein N0V82_008437 [Gnomoniopsis sp. IMI 355080]|nr:hypothetical protein N0V82_008437 [Gnomoniopsis sp. IMI 355080]